MARQMFDPSSKWMLEEQGRSILYLGGARDVLFCKARKAEVVQPRKLPDGLLEATFASRKGSRLVLVEVATYPEERVVEQIRDDIRLVRQARGVLPEALVLCLCPKGNYRVPQQAEEKSALGWTAETLSWKVVELWTLSAEELLTAPDVALALWALLARFEGPPEVLLQRCRERIDRDGGTKRDNLLAVAQVFARLHFDKPEWLEILGGKKAMIESPFIQEIVEESSRSGGLKLLLHILRGKFGSVPERVSAGLAQMKDEEKLLRLGLDAATCPSMPAFEEALRKELPAPPPASTRGKRKARKPPTERQP
jgi:hypothetical protein